MTIRASNCLAAITGTLGLFAIGSAHADTRLGAALTAAAPVEKIVIRAGFFQDRPCDEHRYREPKPCYHKRWRPRQVHRHPIRWRPYYGSNYEIYTYRRPYALGPRTDVQMIYGWYRGYYYPYPYYAGVGY
jgi:hypothetical protein